MHNDVSLFQYFWYASAMVKLVMLVLLGLSVLSWTIIIQRYFQLKQYQLQMRKFYHAFWSGIDLMSLFQQTRERGAIGLASIFRAGYSTFTRHKAQGMDDQLFNQTVERALRVASSKELGQLESSLPFLATVGSVSPFIGLFGTVWGIMTSFHMLGNAEQATIAMVAPGISEALVATAMGLMAAIPATIAYNRFAQQITRIDDTMNQFQDEFMGIVAANLSGTNNGMVGQS